MSILKKKYFYAFLISVLCFQPFMFLLGLIPHKNSIENLFVYIIGFLGTLHIVMLTLVFLFLSMSTHKTKGIKNNFTLKIITLFLILFNIVILIGPSSLRKERDTQIQLYKYRIQESRY